ncbi:hypothetical protein HX021_12910 [Sphingobacterium sp. N143]|uniref:hypothetical protein n=1 Tax=Sphingobacterium sp. N143 TaxID=2746727 RepID=UPI002576BC62|nr:hypothetical protein [Sphingobacterium sp. N143]MDM1295181.1 hypothetical protein [Sphingobacterium sp. N143]
MRDNLKDFVNAHRDEFDHREPAADLWKKIQPQIAPQPQVKKVKTLWKWVSIAAAVVLVGTAAFVAFYQYEGHDSAGKMVDIGPVTVRKNSTGPITTQQQDATVEMENKNTLRSIQTASHAKAMVERTAVHKSRRTATMDQAVEPAKIDYLLMLQDSSSASTRLSAVLELKKQETLNNAVTVALEKAATSDQNSNVRMAAIETLLNGMAPEDCEQKVQDLFIAQNDPTLQVELMQLIAQRDELAIKAETKEKLNEIVEDPLTMDFVKERAYAVLLNQ